MFVFVCDSWSAMRKEEKKYQRSQLDDFCAFNTANKFSHF